MKLFTESFGLNENIQCTENFARSEEIPDTSENNGTFR